MLSTYQGLIHSGLQETMSHDYLVVLVFMTPRQSPKRDFFSFSLINIILLPLLLFHDFAVFVFDKLLLNIIHLILCLQKQ